MSYLLYCLFQHQEEPGVGGPAGVHGQAIAILSRNGLSAVISMISAPQLSPEHLDTIMSYQRVINYFHRKATIIPMRFGCVFSEEAQVVRFLEEQSEGYRALLQELDGCVEMGIRVLLNNPESRERVQSLECPDSLPPVPDLVGTGREYLSARRSCYADRDRLGDEAKAVIETVRGPFDGLFVRCKAEKSMPGQVSCESSVRMLSLYFLVKREEVEKFRQVFHAFTARCSGRILLSGPWPPFNFVVPGVS